MSDEQAPQTGPSSQPGTYDLALLPGPSGSETRRYRIIGVLGRGGFGTVYHARLEGSDDFVKDVAIKLLTETNPAPETLSRFRDEARILGRLRDRSIVSVDPPTRLDGRWGVVMEYVDGVDCRRLIREHGRLPPTVALGIVEEVARTLDNLWNHPGEDGQPMRLLHRDLKPSNLQITPTGAVKVLDFGVARADFGQRETTTTAHIAGTVGYIAPERGEGIEDPRGDVFSLGVVLEELVTGRRPMRPGESSRSASKRLGTGTVGASRTPDSRAPDSRLQGPRSRSHLSTPGGLGSTPGGFGSTPGGFGSTPGGLASTPGASSANARSQVGLARASQRLATNPGLAGTPGGPPALPPPEDAVLAEVLRFAQDMRAQNPTDRPWASEVEERCAALVRSLDGPTLREWARDHVHHAPLAPLQSVPDALVGQMLSETLARVNFDKGPAQPRTNQAFAAALLAVSATAAMLVVLVGLGSLGAGVWWWSHQRSGGDLARVESPTVGDPTVADPARPSGGMAPGTEPEQAVDGPHAIPTVPAVAPVVPVAVEPRPRPRPPRPPRPIPVTTETGTVTQEGAVSIELSGEEGRFDAGKVPVGTYAVSATFEGSEPVSAGVVDVTAGSRIQLRCDARFKRCMQR